MCPCRKKCISLAPGTFHLPGFHCLQRAEKGVYHYSAAVVLVFNIDVKNQMLDC